MLAGELVRRVSGQTVGAFLRERVAKPHGLDMHIGIAEEMDTRVADLVAGEVQDCDLSVAWLSSDDLLQD